MTELTAEQIGPDVLAKLKAAGPGGSVVITENGVPVLRLVTYPGMAISAPRRASGKWESRRVAEDLDALPGEFAERTG